MVPLILKFVIIIIIIISSSSSSSSEIESGTGNNRGNWNHLKITQTVPEQYTGEHEIKEPLKTVD
jgi:hypothetical protein